MAAFTSIALGVTAIAAVAGTVSGMVSSSRANDLAEQGLEMTEGQVEQQLKLQEQAQAELDKQREA